jgi:hypothetical protein
MDRRAFIRGGVALGLSVSAAAALADRVRASSTGGASRRSAKFVGDVYDDDTYGDDTYGPSELPSTGAGTASTSSSWKPLAILGAGAAVAAGALRRLKGAESTAE